jgi:hypothetical protein
MIRLLAATVVAACIISLGADLTQAAYGAAQTAQTVTLAALPRA